MRIFIIFSLFFSFNTNAQEISIDWDNWSEMYNFPAKERKNKSEVPIDCDSFLLENPLFNPFNWAKIDEKGVRLASPPINPFYFDKNCIENYLGRPDSSYTNTDTEISIYYLNNTEKCSPCQGFCVAFFFKKPYNILFHTQRGSYFKN